MDNQPLITIINREMGLALPEDLIFEQVRLKLQTAIGSMIANDFQKLAGILYRVDVNERKLKYLLQENVGQDAAIIIADLIIERQIEKIESRKKISRNNQNDDVSDEDKW